MEQGAHHPGGLVNFLTNRPTKYPKFRRKQKAIYPTRRYAMRRIQESILEFKLRYGIEVLFNTPTAKAIYKSFMAMIECLIDLIKPHKTKDIY